MALDDLKMSDSTFPEHVKHLNMVLGRVTEVGAEFSIDEKVWAAHEVEYWGFLLSSDGRRPTPGKITQLANWPGYEELADLRSHVHFVEYLKEIIPGLPDEIAPLGPYFKKGATT